MRLHSPAILAATALVALSLFPSPAAAAPDIEFLELVSLVSTQVYTQDGATTTHDFPNPAPPTGDGVLRLDVDGDYGSTSEYADLYIEGALPGRVADETGVDCTPAAGEFSISLADLTAYALDGVIQVSVVNSGGVGSFCDENYHTVTLNYPAVGDSADFGTVSVGASFDIQARVANNGPSTLDVASISSDTAEFTVTPTSMTVPPFTFVDVTLTFTPLGEATYQGTLTVVSNDPDQPELTVELIGNGIFVPGISVAPNSINTTVMQGQSVTEALTITNGGQAPLNFLITPSQSWASTDPVAGTVAVLGTQPVDVILDAATLAVGSYFCWLDIESNDPDNPVLSIPVDLTVLPAPDINVDPSPSVGLDFGTVELGAGRRQILTIENLGAAMLVVGSITSDAVEFVPAVSSATVPPGGSVSFWVTFTPPALGPFAGTLSISSNDPDEPLVTLAMSGEGVPPPVIGVLPVEFNVTVPAGESQVETLVVSNAGPGTLTFEISENSLWLDLFPGSGSVPPADSMNVNVTFDARDLAQGVYLTDLTIVSNDPLQPTLSVPVELSVILLPDINVGRAVELISIQEYDVSGATTLHQIPIALTPSEGGTIELLADGNFGGPTETALLFVEGVSMGTVGTSGVGCGPVSDSFRINEADLASLVLDGIVDGLVLNSPDVGAICPVNSHTLRLNYLEEIAGLNYGSIPVTGTGEQTFHVENSGALPLQVGPLTIGTPEFTVSPTSFTLGAGAKETITVAFRPTAIAPFTGVLSIPSTDLDEPLVTLALTGTGTQPGTIGLAPLSMSSTLHSGEQEAQTLAVSNTGVADLEFSISAAWTTEPLSPTALFLHFEPHQGSVPPSGLVNVDVYFTTLGLPVGVHEAQISVSSNDPLNPVVVVPATFTVTSAPHIQIPGEMTTLESSIDYDSAGAVTTHALNGAGPPVGTALVVLQATGNFKPPGRTATLSGEGTEFGAVGNVGFDCATATSGFGVPAVLLAGMAGNDIFSFDVANTIDVQPSCETNRHTVSLMYRPEAVTLGFGSVELGLSRTLPLIIENNGTELLEVSSISSDTAEFTVSIASASVQPNDSVTLDVTLTPSSQSNFSGLLELQSDDPDRPLIQIALAGGGSCVDEDGDGVTTCDGDCDDSKPFCTFDCTDQDGDDYCVSFDCDDLIASCNLECIDADSDGMPVCAGDCDDGNPYCSTDCTDADSDGVCIPADCDDLNFFCDFDCTDSDSDGYCVTSDCDDTSPGCTSDCTDADSDGMRACDGDCDDTNANCTTDCTDLDADGYCVTTDCYDLNANCTTDCTDADEDGYCVTTDCDETNANCTTDCTDLDEDGYCVTADCDDSLPQCTTDCTDLDSDGFCVTTDCDEANANCTSDCTDADADGYCVTTDCDEMNANCASDCTDADADGYCVTSDCDDSLPHCTTDCTDLDGDGYCVTTDCDDSSAQCTVDCTDLDGDGYCATTDCDETNPNCNSDCTDSDGDGYCVTTDCDDTLALCNTDCTDADADGYCAIADCDETNPNCTTDCTDVDEDGYCVTSDCDDGKPNCTTDCTDVDADGYCPPQDCDDTTASCAEDCTDADGDGMRVCDGDCDDDKPFCTTDCTDFDDDGYCVTFDCDDDSPFCTTDCTDVDADGYCLPQDCDDTDPDCSIGCTDADMDGWRVCEGDCDDGDPTSYPGATEICTDGNDNDCNGFTDEQDELCGGLAAAHLRFETGDTASITWDAPALADWYGLYRGTIPESGFVAYRHLCEAAQISGTTAVDPDLPPAGEGFYYLVAGQRLDADDGNRWLSGSLGRSSDGASRPESDSIPCGPRVYVDPDLVVEGDGLSWATAYTGVGVALVYTEARERGLEIWARGTVQGAAGTVDQATRAGVRILGGFAGTETASWERDPETHPTIWQSPGSQELIRINGVSLVLDALTLTGTVNGVVALPAGAWTELRDVSFEPMGGWGVDMTTTTPAHLVVEGCEFIGSAAGGVRSIAEAGTLSGRVRGNVFEGGSDAALSLEARPSTSNSSVELDVVANVIAGGSHGIKLRAQVDDRPLVARQASFVASNLIYGTSGVPILVEATGDFVTATGAAAVLAEPLVIGNTLTDGGASGLAVSASRNDVTGNSQNHIVRAAPQIWDNLITFNAGPGILEVQDDPAAGVSCDPAAVVGNDLHGNQVLYLDEGTDALTLPAEVNLLPGAADNFDEPPGYLDRVNGDYHLNIGTVLGYGSTMRHLVNVGDPGLALSWTVPAFDDSAWGSGRYGVGYDTGSPPNAVGLLETVVPPGAFSIYTRATFTLDDLSQVVGLKIGADYDDGFVAWINGVEVFRSFSMPAGDPAWDAAANPHESSNAANPVYEVYDVSAAALVLGTNVLAIGIWNEGAVQDDLVLVPLLVINDEVAAVDAGHLDAPRLAREDFDGDARVVDGDRDGIGRPDVGADER